jgi:hypothetical protein
LQYQVDTTIDAIAEAEEEEENEETHQRATSDDALQRMNATKGPQTFYSGLSAGGPLLSEKEKASMKNKRKTSFDEEDTPAPKKNPNRESRFLKQLEKTSKDVG